MRKHLLLLPAIAVVLSACGGAPQARPVPNTPAPATTPAPAAPTTDLTVQPPPDDPAAPPPAAVLPQPAVPAPSAVLSRFLDAVQTGNAPQAWDLLSQESRREMGGTLDAFITHALPGLRNRFAVLKGYRLALNRQISPRVAAVAVTADRPDTGMDVAAMALVSEAGNWKVSLTHFPITPLSRPGAGLIGFRTAETNIALDQLWLDDVPLTPARSNSTVTAPLPPALSPGEHVAVALSVDTNGVPTAYGWLYKPVPR